MVVDIVFLSEFFDVNETTITNYTALGQEGDDKMTSLIEWLNGTSPTGGSSTAKSSGSTLSTTHNTTVFTGLLLFVSAIMFFM
jgi:hypothetical protein